METKINVFSPKQENFISEYLQSGNITQAAKKAGVTKKAVYRWLKNGLEEEIAERQKKIADKAIKQMQTATVEATNYLLSVVKNEQSPSSEKLKAADLLTRNGLKAFESDRLALLADLENKLEELSE
ncbi:MAG: terminase small subunit [Treponema sp.]|nr:terminase small subunit [Treponema sp.]